MFCTNCGNEVDAQVRFCPNCGTPVAAGGKRTSGVSVIWEYKDLQIPLNVEFSIPVLQDQNFSWSALTESQHQCERIILQQLQLAGKDSWQADEPTDFKTLFKSKRIAWHQTNQGASTA